MNIILSILCQDMTPDEFSLLPRKSQDIIYRFLISNSLPTYTLNYKYILFSAGIYTRRYLTHLGEINPGQHISSEMKAALKLKFLYHFCLHRTVKPSLVCLFDDNKVITDYISSQSQFNTVNIRKYVGLQKRDLKNLEKYRYIFFDFDCTLTVRKFRRKDLNKQIDEIVHSFMGGEERIRDLSHIFRTFERENRNLGILSFSTHETVYSLLKILSFR